MKTTLLFALALFSLTLVGCSENYSNGERIGFVTKFSNRGLIWKSWEGELNLTQTGMNTSSTFQFSIDNDRQDDNTTQQIKILDSAATQGWKVKIRYHETAGKNWFRNRGETDHFVETVEVLDRTPLSVFNTPQKDGTHVAGKVDTIYLVIWHDKK
jgi:AAA15 family ATPase/GTPase